MNTTQAIERLGQVLRRQHKALSTEEAYVFWLRRYMKALPNMPAQLSSEKKLEHFLTQLAINGVSASSQNQAFNAVLYFYREVMEKPIGRINALRAKRPVHERHAPTVGETQLLLNTIRNEGGYPTNLISRLLYGCGLRVTEPLNLRIKDVDLERRTLCIRGAKGGSDRVVAVPACLVGEITQQMQVARAVHAEALSVSSPLDFLPIILPAIPAKPTELASGTDQVHKPGSAPSPKPKSAVRPTVPTPTCPPVHKTECKAAKSQPVPVHSRMAPSSPVPQKKIADFHVSGLVVLPKSHRPPNASHLRLSYIAGRLAYPPRAFLGRTQSLVSLAEYRHQVPVKHLP